LLGGTIQPEFAFNTLAQATLASQALLDQVFVDGESGAFDSDPALTYGCDFPFSCLTFVPYEVYSQFGDTGVNAAVSVNYYVNFATDFVTQLQRGRFDSDEANPGIIAVNFAVLSPRPPLSRNQTLSPCSASRLLAWRRSVVESDSSWRFTEERGASQGEVKSGK
jgi:hypothetical protein